MKHAAGRGKREVAAVIRTLFGGLAEFGVDLT
jgi:hypothetical protein